MLLGVKPNKPNKQGMRYIFWLVLNNQGSKYKAQTQLWLKNSATALERLFFFSLLFSTSRKNIVYHKFIILNHFGPRRLLRHLLLKTELFGFSV